jgi:hypothetical protein
MLKDLLKKELRQIGVGINTSVSLETSIDDVALGRQMNGAIDRAALRRRNGHFVGPHPGDVLATARTASGM